MSASIELKLCLLAGGSEVEDSGCFGVPVTLNELLANDQIDIESAQFRGPPAERGDAGGPQLLSIEEGIVLGLLNAQRSIIITPDTGAIVSLQSLIDSGNFDPMRGAYIFTSGALSSFSISHTHTHSLSLSHYFHHPSASSTD